MLETPVRGTIGTEKFRTVIHWRNGILIADEPEKTGGKDLGPDPYTLLLSSLVTCTLVTLRMYINLKSLDIPEIEVEANMCNRIGPDGTVLQINRNINLRNVADPGLRERLMRVADNCPVSKILKGTIDIRTEII